MGGSSNPTTRIVIVDDSAVFRSALRSIVGKQDGWEIVGEAANGFDALALCRKVHPDLVLMDLHMPVMDGLSAAGALKRWSTAIRVVLMTSDDAESVRRATSEFGVDGCLIKSADGHEFLARLRRVLNPVQPG